MYGDTAVIRGLSRQLGEQADDVLAEADGLVALADRCVWTGWAADAMRRRSRARAAALRRCAGRHRDAAEALARHADEVDRVKDVIAAAERRVTRLLGELGDLGDDLGEGLGDLVQGFLPPPPGHRDWLRVEIPGLTA